MAQEILGISIGNVRVREAMGLCPRRNAGGVETRLPPRFPKEVEWWEPIAVPILLIHPEGNTIDPALFLDTFPPRGGHH